ncbi:MAG TPA: hypothetical protein VM364_04255 [Vicinamibacterales bacterium]|nr:hypothetical protein [Vicinamibacterales bacterium]
MKATIRFATAVAALFAVSLPATAQTPVQTAPVAVDTAAAEPEKKKEKEDDKAAPADLPQILKERPITMQHFRPLDKRGLNVFETPKEAGVEYTGFKLDWGAAFTSQVQSLTHANTAAPVMSNGVNANQLADIGFGFNNSTANLYLNAQLAKGIRVALTSYLSSRHHPETWVKDGYLLVDASPIDLKPLHKLFEFTTLRIGHFEINYGDAHFRRTDNGNAVYNPFVGNYIMDAFTTEIGGEVYFRRKGLLAMGSITGGEVRGTVLSPGKRGPTVIGKLGFDRQVQPNLRVRLTGSMYHAERSLSNTLYGGDRAGSRYYFVLENTAAAEATQFTSAHINPGFRNAVTAFQVNPFVKFGGLEVFGVLERAEGRAAAEASDRRFAQQAVDVVYRLLPGEPVFIGARYNRVEGRLANMASDVRADRWQVGGGWFLTSGLLMKAEYVNQKFSGYPATHIRNGGKFRGFMFEGVVAF